MVYEKTKEKFEMRKLKRKILELDQKIEDNSDCIREIQNQYNYMHKNNKKLFLDVI